MIDPRRAQRSFGDKLIAEEVKDLHEDWMIHADEVLADEEILVVVYEALAKRRRLSRTRGRKATPAEVVLRLLVLKHIRSWSYATLEREVRTNLLYRNFTRLGFAKMPDAKTMGRWGVALGPGTIKKIHQRIVRIAQEKAVVQGRKMRVDTTVVETNIHYPTDSSLLGDGVRVLTRVMKKITGIVGGVGAKLHDRSRSVKYRVLEIARAARAKGPQSRAKLERAYGNLLMSTSRVVGQAKRFAREIADGTKRVKSFRKQAKLELLRCELATMLPRVRQVIKQTRARIFRGDTRSEGKILSLFCAASPHPILPQLSASFSPLIVATMMSRSDMAAPMRWRLALTVTSRAEESPYSRSRLCPRVGANRTRILQRPAKLSPRGSRGLPLHRGGRRGERARCGDRRVCQAAHSASVPSNSRVCCDDESAQCQGVLHRTARVIAGRRSVVETSR
jgi:hypothetical protein